MVSKRMPVGKKEEKEVYRGREMGAEKGGREMKSDGRKRRTLRQDGDQGKERGTREGVGGKGEQH